MKLFLLLGLLLLPACAVAPASDTSRDLPPDIQLSADAITARQTSDAALSAAQQAQASANAARARAEQYSAQQTAIAQATHDAAAYASTRVALDIQIANVTRQAALDMATATENARRVNIANAETSQARSETRAAVQTQTRRAEESAMLAASQTRQSAYPTQTRIAEQIAEEQLARQRAAAIAAAQAEWDANVKPVQNFIAWVVLPLVGACGFLFVLLFGFWKLFRAFEDYVRSKSIAAVAPALAQMQIRDAYGRPLGFLQMQNGAAVFTPYYFDELPPPETPALPAVVMRDMVDRAAIENTTAAPDPAILGGFIHYTSLRAFVETILQTGDWTQTTWADKSLPRGFVLTKDTRDERGNVIHGNYARLLELFVENNLIINRRKGAAGQWNPHAPRDVDGVMAILYHEQPKPPLPSDASASPIAARSAPASA